VKATSPAISRRGFAIRERYAAIRDKNRGARGSGICQLSVSAMFGQARSVDDLRRIQAVKRRRAAKLCVQKVEAHVEVFGDIPLGPRTKPPG
jgi:hypothetical protein